MMCVFVMLLNYAGDEREAFEWPASVWWCVSCKFPSIQDEQECHAEFCMESGLMSAVRSDALRHTTT